MTPPQTGLPPIAAPDATVLILGSFPGTESLRLGQYYAFRQNRFWHLMERIAGVGRALPYELRTAGLLREGIALWDSLHACVRAGALDSRIVRGTERANDFPRFFASHPRLRRVVFNGQTAAATFHRLVPSETGARRERIQFTTAPSTSPANARYSIDVLERAWREALGRDASA